MNLRLFCRRGHLFARLAFEYALRFKRDPAQDHVVGQVTVEGERHAVQPLPHGKEDGIEQKRDLLAVLLHKLRARSAAVRLGKGIIPPLFDVLFIVVERVDEIHPLADGIEEFFACGGRTLFEEMHGEFAHEFGGRFRRAVQRSRFRLFDRRLPRHILLDEGDHFRIPLFRALVALFKPRTFDSAACAVRNVVGDLLIGERRVERAQLRREIVHHGDGAFADGVLEAVLPLDLHVDARHVVEQRRKKGDVVGKPEARALTARGGNALAQSAVERLIEHEVFDKEVGQIVANVSEHRLLSSVKPDFAVHFGERFAGGVGCALRAALQNARQIPFIRQQTFLFRLHGRERVGNGLADGEFEVAVPLPLELPFRLGNGAAFERRVNVQKVGDARLFVGSDDAVIAVGHGALELAHDRIAVVGEVHRRVGVLVRLAHFAERVLQRGDLRALFEDIRLGNAERFAVTVVEADGNIARDFEVLTLIDADGYEICLIQENIRRHEHGIVHQSHVHVFGVAGGFILVLRHALHFAHIRDGIEHPREFGVRRDVGLHVERALFGIDAAGDIERGKFERAAAQKRRLLPHRDGVHIGNGVKTGEFALHIHPITDRADIISDGKIAARLNRRI